MKKNVASQLIGVQMITAADGTDFTGSITCTIAKDGAAPAASGGTGPTHQATGYYEYNPTQAETNYDHIAFHFVGTGAISTTVQVYTTFPQTVDNNVLAAGATGFAAINTDVEAILVDTATTIPATITTAQADLDTITGADGVALASTQQSITFQPITITAGDAVPNVTFAGTGSEDGISFERAGTGDMYDAVIMAQLNAEMDTAISDSGIKAETALIVADTNELQTDWADGGRLDLLLDGASSAGDPWTTSLPGAYGAGTAGKIIGDNINAPLDTIDTNVDSILVDTAEIGTAGAGLTDLGGMSTGMKAEVNAEADTALTDYDGPTNTEMEARTPTAAQLLYMTRHAATAKPVTFTTSGGSTTAAVLNLVDGSAASATADVYNSRLLVFNSGTLDEQVCQITDYAATTKVATITAVTTAVTSSHTALLV